MQCPQCQHKNRSQARFCDACGAPVARLEGGAQPALSYTEVQRSLSEAREQQTATAEILRVIGTAPTDAHPVFEAIACSSVQVCGALSCGVFVVDGEMLHLAATHGVPAARIERFRSQFPAPLTSPEDATRAVRERSIFHMADIANNPAATPAQIEVARLGGYCTRLLVPMLRGDNALGLIAVTSAAPTPFSERQVSLLQTFADQAVIAIESVRLFTELQQKNEALTTAHSQVSEALEQQTATSEILRVISQSPTDTQPVFDAIVERALRLSEATVGAVAIFDGELIHVVASNLRPDSPILRVFPMRPRRTGSLAARTVFERQIIHVPDALAEPEYNVSQQAAESGYRSVLSVPMLRDGTVVGTIIVGRSQAGRYLDRQIALLQIFADQAVIAIENVRLFKELETKNRDLTESLAQQTATGEILDIIAHSPTDIRPVLDTVAESAARLCEASDVAIFRLEGDRLRVAAHHGPIPLQPASDATISLHGTVPGRSVLEARTIHVTDLQEEAAEFPEGSELARRFGFRTSLTVPLIRQGAAVGTITLRRTEARRFSERQVALLQTFADQAVIAIENVRLFTELQEKNRALTQAHAQVTEALEQQTATAEILRVISSSPTDVQPVFETIVKNAARLCDAFDAVIFQVDPGMLRLVAHEGPVSLGPVGQFTVPLVQGVLTGRVALERRAIQVADHQAEDHEYPEGTAIARRYGVRTMLGVPLMRAAEVVGVIALRRAEVRPFTDRQIALLQTFADQAVIAIENVRLFKELEARNDDLTEALDQQTATTDILRVIPQSPTDVQPVFDMIAESAARLCEAQYCFVYRFEGQLLHFVAHHGLTAEVLEINRSAYPAPPGRRSVAARAVVERSVVQIPDVNADPDYALGAMAAAGGYRSAAAVPILRDGLPIGSIAVTRAQAGLLPDRQIDLLKTFADQAVIAIENVRLFKELQEKNEALTQAHAQVSEALEQQTATAEILRVISSSPTDVQPVFDTIVRSAVRLCNGLFSALMQFDGELLHFVAQHNHTPEALEEVRRVYPARPTRALLATRAILDRAVVHIPDVEVDPEYQHHAIPRAIGFRSGLFVPMLREGAPIGVIMVSRAEPGLFSDNEVELLKTFADQAVIAIENVRLFKELEARNTELTETLEQQTATSEILRVISQSQRDVQPVFDTIVRNAVRLCGALQGGVYRFDGELVHSVAHDGYTPEQLAQWRSTWPRPVTAASMACQAIRTRSLVRIPDLDIAASLPGFSPEALANLRARGTRSVMAVPMWRQSEVIGAISLAHCQLDAFSATQVELLTTFADQAVIAIENVRLFTELEARNHDLTEALEQQTATSDILRIISSSPTDLQPVLDTVVRSAARFCGAYDACIFRLDGDHLRLDAHHGPVTQPDGFLLPMKGSVGGRTVLERQVIHVADLPAETAEFPEAAANARRLGFRTILSVPLVREGVTIGAIQLRRPESVPFTDKQVSLLQIFADQAVIAIENVRLFTELQASNRGLIAALDTQTASSDILRVISQSQTDVQPVFDAIVTSAVRLLGAYAGVLTRIAGDQIELAALTSTDDAGDAALRARFPQSLQSEGTHAQAIHDRAPLNVADYYTDPRLPEAGRAAARVRGYRSLVVVPMLRHNEAVGAISVTRREPGGFTDDEIALLKTFADQAVIAIENARLLSELQARTQELTRSVSELQALGEVGQAISSTLDLETVLQTIVSRAVQLSGLDGGVVFEYDEGTEEFVQRAATDPGGALTEARRTTRIRKGEGVLGRTAITLEAIQVPDITVPGAYEGRLRETLVESGIRAILAVPMVREAQLIGCLGVTRNHPGDFPAVTIDLLKTFATQSALAIQNARLFHEIEDKSRQLEAASRHKSEFLANMSHELRTPLNAVIGFSEVLLQRMFGALNEKQDEYLKDIYASGQHLLSLINDILDLSKIEAGRMELTPAPFHLPSALENAVTLVKERAARHGIALRLDLDPRLGELVGDERKVKQVLLNLLSNAVKFTPEGGRISLKAAPRDGAVEIAVTDTGIGIAPEDQAAIFEEFRQVGSDETRKQEGTGLGLTLAKKFVELHGGRIWVESKLGSGSTFTFTLPMS